MTLQRITGAGKSAVMVLTCGTSEQRDFRAGLLPSKRVIQAPNIP